MHRRKQFYNQPLLPIVFILTHAAWKNVAYMRHFTFDNSHVFYKNNYIFKKKCKVTWSKYMFVYNRENPHKLKASSPPANPQPLCIHHRGTAFIQYVCSSRLFGLIEPHLTQISETFHKVIPTLQLTLCPNADSLFPLHIK